jgi:hypothetical protein
MAGPQKKKAKQSSESQGSSSNQANTSTNITTNLQNILLQTQRDAAALMAASLNEDAQAQDEELLSTGTRAQDAAFTNAVIAQIAQILGAAPDCKLRGTNF